MNDLPTTLSLSDVFILNAVGLQQIFTAIVLFTAFPQWSPNSGGIGRSGENLKNNNR